MAKFNDVKDGKLIITDNQMQITRQNLVENNSVFLQVFTEDHSLGLKISRKASYYTRGSYFIM
ncbi:MAG: hypothetical protein ACOX6V_01415 [Patescibacteria group bacterium]